MKLNKATKIILAITLPAVVVGGYVAVIQIKKFSDKKKREKREQELAEILQKQAGEKEFDTEKVKDALKEFDDKTFGWLSQWGEKVSGDNKSVEEGENKMKELMDLGQNEIFSTLKSNIDFWKYAGSIIMTKQNG